MIDQPKFSEKEIECIKKLIEYNNIVEDMSPVLKKVKQEKTEFEKVVVDFLKRKDIKLLNTLTYQIFRYDDRIIVHKLKE